MALHQLSDTVQEEKGFERHLKLYPGEQPCSRRVSQVLKSEVSQQAADSETAQTDPHFHHGLFRLFLLFLSTDLTSRVPGNSYLYKISSPHALAVLALRSLLHPSSNGIQ